MGLNQWEKEERGLILMHKLFGNSLPYKKNPADKTLETKNFQKISNLHRAILRKRFYIPLWD